MELTPRKERILSSVVAGYVKSGEPVGSKTVAEEVGVSSATVRNEMADLIELGLLEQPHTSAGRVPSQKGYREYVDRLMEVPPVKEEERRVFDSMLLSGSYEPEQLLGRAARLLAGATRCAAVATTPSGDTAQVRAVQFVQTSRRTAMLILMSSAGTMKTRVFHCDFDLTNDILRVFFRVFNGKLAGKNVSDITPAFLQGVGVSLGEMYVLMGARRKGRVCIAEDQDRQRDAVAAQVARFAQAADREPGRPGPVQRAGDSHGPVAVGVRLDDGAHRPPGRAVHIGEIIAQGVEVDLGPAVAFEPVFIAIALHGVFLPKAARYFIGLL